MLPVFLEFGNLNFVVSVRCRSLYAHEKTTTFVHRAQECDSCYYCVFLNKALPSPPSSTGVTEKSGREEDSAGVVLADPGACSETGVLWNSCAFSQGGPSLLLRLGAHELRRLCASVGGTRTSLLTMYFHLSQHTGMSTVPLCSPW